MKEILKKLIKSLPIAFTRNQRYDKLTKKIIKTICKADSNCVDVGCHKGEVLDIMRKYAPEGKHFGFEPIPDLYIDLVEKYSGSTVKIYDFALSNNYGTATFNYVVTNPSYSGLIKRKYDNPHEEDTSIVVKTEKMDTVIPLNTKVDLIKIDVEGGELLVLEGAVEILKRDKPVVIFEHGIGASDYYGSSPDKIHNLFTNCKMKIFTLENFLNKGKQLTLAEFEKQYYNQVNYYFVASA
ncbi:MAG: FkbM family methyltransferase [Saprospiraceae bacterium]|nr:FkbM family methyltransferase [Saprospiraceae bacterium]